MDFDAIERTINNYSGILTIFGICAASIIGTISIIVTIIIAVISIKLTKKQNTIAEDKTIKKNFRVIWKRARAITTFDILKFREGRFNKYYFKRDQDKEILKAVRKRKSVLIIGQPLSGKTRAVYEVLKKFQVKWFHDILIAHLEDVDRDNFTFPKHFKWWRRRILFIDDLQLFAEKRNFDHLIEEAYKQGLKIIAICRSGFQFEVTESKMKGVNLYLDDIFPVQVEIGDIDNNDARHIADEAGVDFRDNNFDGNVGSIFMPLTEMRLRYEEDCKSVEKNVLKVMKRMFDCGVFVGDHVFPRTWVETAYTKKHKAMDESKWDSLFERLVSLEFVNWIEGELEGEEVYFEKVVELTPQRDKFAVWWEMTEAFADEPAALLHLGDRAYDSGQYVLDKAMYMKVAIGAYQGALRGFTSENNPEKYGWVNNNLANAYRNLSEVEEKAANCHRAIAACKEALKVRTLNDFPLDYAMTQNNLAIGLVH